MDNQNLYKLKKDFINEWPIERLKTMTLEEYTNSKKTSFCYWLEAITTNVGSIWGGSAYKFGIFKRKHLKKTDYNDYRKSDGIYSWHEKYGKNKEEVFGNIRNLIIKIVIESKENRLEEIDNIDLGDAVKWKIAFLYGEFNVINIFTYKALKTSAEYLGYIGNSKLFSELNRFILSKKGDKDFFDFAKELWIVFDSEKIMKQKFEKWLKIKKGTDSGMVSSYLRAINLLNNQFKIKVYNESDISVLNELYEDLKLHQKTVDGKYFYSKAKSYGQNGFYSAAVKTYIEFLQDSEIDDNEYKKISFDDMKNNTPLNQILYGPPGTGKTYNTIVKAAEIIENRKIDDFSESKAIFNKHLGNRIEFITFHQNYSYEDFIQGLRPDVDNDTSLTFDRKDGIFKMISDRALENLYLSEKAPEEVSKDALFDNALEDFIEKVQDSEDDYHINDSVAYITEVLDNSFRYKGPNWGHSSLMKFKDLKELYRNDVKKRQDIKKLSTISGLANQHASYFLRVYNEIVKLLPKQEVVDTTTKVERENYVIIIDEINRANISRVFGELITLIELDKRSHGDIPLKSTLPSGEEFMVASNLYIIGTMNTADKSIALLDIALRRRFEFVAMYPKYSIDDHEIYDVDILEKINKKIIEKKGHDFQIGHSYFMGVNNDLIGRMNVKVIPLLLEYFMNDEKEVKEILTHAGLEIEPNSWPLRITGKRDQSI